MLIKAVPTGRKSKEDERVSTITVAGVKLTVREFDAWEGGVPGEGVRQQYHRCVEIVQPKVEWNHA